MTTPRIDWHSYAMWLAWTASARSEARAIDGDKDEPRKTGAAILERTTNRVLALGYNGFPPGFKVTNDFYTNPARRVSHIIHAEINALVYCPKGKAGLIAITQAPCAGCARAIIAHEIPLVLYGEDHWDQTGLEILRFYGVETRYLPLLPLIEDWVHPAIAEYHQITKPLRLPNSDSGKAPSQAKRKKEPKKTTPSP